MHDAKLIDLVQDRMFVKQSGEIGIEIEVEGQSLYIEQNKFWAYKRDGSLRGEGMEYVLIKPVRRNDVDNVLKILLDLFIKAETKLKLSDRCGVHIHINCQQNTITQIVNFIALYIIFEEILIEYCGEDRVGNIFCLTTKDAEGPIQNLRHIYANNDPYSIINNDDLKYASVNFAGPLINFGSIEFRGLRTPENFKRISEWISILLTLKDASKSFDNPAEIVDSLSSTGYRDFYENIFGETYSKILDCDNLESKIQTGVRLVQDFAYVLLKKNGIKCRAYRPMRADEF